MGLFQPERLNPIAIRRMEILTASNQSLPPQ